MMVIKIPLYVYNLLVKKKGDEEESVEIESWLDLLFYRDLVGFQNEEA